MEVSVDSFTLQVTSAAAGQYLARFAFGSNAESIATDGNYVATIDDVTDVAGNDSATPPPQSFFVLRGDANRDRRVNALDFDALATSFGKTGAQFSDGDFNHDGQVTTADFTLLATRFNTTLPQFPPGAVPAALFSQAPIQPRDSVTDMWSGSNESPENWVSSNNI
jgi:hypothetical protein